MFLHAHTLLFASGEGVYLCNRFSARSLRDRLGQRRSCKGTVGLVRNGGAPAGGPNSNLSVCLQTLEMRRNDSLQPSIFLVFWAGGLLAAVYPLRGASRIARASLSTVRDQARCIESRPPYPPGLWAKGDRGWSRRYYYSAPLRLLPGPSHHRRLRRRRRWYRQTIMDCFRPPTPSATAGGISARWLRLSLRRW